LIGNIQGSITSPGANTQILFNNAGAIDGNAAVTFDSATGNIAMGNLLINKTTSGAVILNTPGSMNANISTIGQGRIVIGNGWNGDYTSTNDVGFELSRDNRLGVMDLVTLPQTSAITRTSSIAGQLSVDMGGTTWTNKRATGMRIDVQVGNGSMNSTSYNLVRAAAYNVSVGNNTATIGAANLQLGAATGISSSTNVDTNSRLGNSLAFLTLGPLSGGAGAIANSQIGYFSTTQWSGVIPDNVIHYYVANTTNRFGTSSSGNGRAATNYYAFRNDDNVAQVQLGSLRSYSEFAYPLSSSSGALTVNKLNGQFQVLTTTEAITSVTYSNFVTSASDGVNTDEQGDTVTLVVIQDATGRAITMPSGATYKYANGANTVSSTASSITMISITAIRISGTTTYLTSISPTFT
jgi:hypothetical protein